ncbi:MAG TPA: TIGR04282 family arsenosugar biosynthesis glycosyltransferase [Burkholderiales bacterium]|nr:TIGR04282 family arsenosugar biosynthesis glycosyltransferase [Burkholderiales bacterium]
MPGSADRSRVIVFAKAPRPGSAKTRLIPLLGADGAASLHARLLEHTLITARSADVGPVELHGTPAGDELLVGCALRHGVRLLDQAEGDLGDRMRHAFEQALREVSSVLLIGSDCPPLRARHLRDARRALAEGCDAVFVPTADGGYALIGLTRVHASVFSGVPWSTRSVMAATRARLETLGWRRLELETLWDVDTPEDYGRLVQSGLLDACEAPHAL